MLSNTRNPQAFPRGGQNGTLQSGMNLRDYFAGQALPYCQNVFAEEDDYFTSSTIETISKMAYKLADAMLDERMKPRTGQDVEQLQEEAENFNLEMAKIQEDREKGGEYEQ